MSVVPINGGGWWRGQRQWHGVVKSEGMSGEATKSESGDRLMGPGTARVHSRQLVSA